MSELIKLDQISDANTDVDQALVGEYADLMQDATNKIKGQLTTSSKLDAAASVTTGRDGKKYNRQRQSSVDERNDLMTWLNAEMNAEQKEAA